MLCKKQKALSYLLPWIQWLHVYAFVSGISIGYAVIIVIDAILVIEKIRNGRWFLHTKRASNKYIFIFGIYMIFSLIFSIMVGGDIKIVSVLNRVLKLIVVYMLILHLDDSSIDWDCYKKSLHLLTYIAVFVIIFQFVQKILTGTYFNFKIPFLKYVNDATEARLSTAGDSRRARSIFTEPSHFVYFVFQSLILDLFGENTKKKDIISAVFVSLGVILSVSSTGYVLLLVVWGYFLLTIAKRVAKKKKYIWICLFVVVLAIIASIMVLTNESLYYAIFRMSSDNDRALVVWKRLYAEADQIESMPWVSRFIGYGMGNIDSVFMNSIIYLMLTTGIIGVIIYLMWIISGIVKNNKMGRIAMVVFAALSVIDMVVFTPTVLGYCALAAYSRRNSNMVSKKRNARKTSGI